MGGTRPKVSATREARLRSATALPALLVAAAALVVAAGPVDATRADTTCPADAASTLAIGIEADSSGWNPGTNSWSPSGSLVASSIYEKLMVVDAQGALVPHLAASVTPSDAATVWTIVVRSGISFHDGSPFDANAVVANLDAYRDGALTKDLYANVASVEADGAATVVVTLTESEPSWPAVLAGEAGWMVEPDSIGTTANTAPVGTGPYRFHSWITDDELTVEAFPSYWGEGPCTDRLEFRPITDPVARAAALEAGDLDLAILDRGQVGMPFSSYRTAGGEESLLLFNNRAPGGGAPQPGTSADAAVRAGIFEVLGGTLPVTDGGQRADQPFDAGDPFHAATSGYPPAPTGSVIPEGVEFELMATPQQLTLAQAAQAAFEAEGVDVSVVVVEPAQFIVKLVFADYEVAVLDFFAERHPAWLAPFLDSAAVGPAGTLSLNMAGVQSAAIDAALTDVREADGLPEMEDAATDLVAAMNEADTFFWVESDTRRLVAAPGVVGLAAVSDLGLADAGPWLASAARTTEPPQFSDVPYSHPFWADIEWMATSGVTGGFADGTYRPGEPVTRQSMSAFLYRLEGSPDGEDPACANAPFPDVPANHLFCGEIAWMADTGVTGGFANGTFQPAGSVSRQSMAAFLYRLAGSPEGEDPACANAPFSDVPASHLFCGEIAWMADTGVTGGFADGTFRPGSAVSRGGMAAFLHRYDDAG